MPVPILSGRVFSREQLLDGVWGRNIYVDERTVDVHVGRLRKAVIRGRELPSYAWNIGKDGSLTARTAARPLEVNLWQAKNETARSPQNCQKGVKRVKSNPRKDNTLNGARPARLVE